MWLHAVQGLWQADQEQGLLGLQQAVEGMHLQAEEVAATAEQRRNGSH
jgi:hypothetical protein